MKNRLKSYLGNVSPWIVIGTSLILVAVVLTLAFMNYNREKEYTGRVLSEKGTALIRAFEAGTRTGMMGRLGQGANIQQLIDETAALPDILYITIVDGDGRVVASSEKNTIGSTFIAPAGLKRLSPSNSTKWRVMDSRHATEAFEVYKLFAPTQRRLRHDSHGTSRHMGMMGGRNSWRDNNFFSGHGGMGRMHSRPDRRQINGDGRTFIFIGMDMTPFKAAINEDLSLTLTMSGTLLLLGLGGFVSLFWMNSHLRSRKLLQDNRALTEEIVANLPEAIVSCSPKGEVNFINPTARQMLAKDVFNPGRTVRAILPENIISLGDEVRRTGFPIINSEMELEKPSGVVIPVAVNVTEIRTGNSEHLGMVYMIRDLTQVRQLQEQIRKADRLAAIGQLAAGVAHEVRNPLSSIKGYATYFGSLFPEDSDNRKAAEVMTTEVERLNRAISELLEMARPADIKLRETDVKTLIESSLRLVSQEAESASVSIETDVAPDMPRITADPDRLAQTLINLYINAIQAMPEGGILGVSAGLAEQGLRITVRDTGGGLPGDDFSRIFDPYYTTKPSGTGLGLAIVQKIVEAHGGTIEVEYSGTQGTSFIITIPASPERQE
ncbi:ATP-binding protein [Maridesulfovibrio sp.]|uniref:ATP-binding protein n=1 Tax=Maridesulfovibrio sp. TaxID=2795000 RepID=UPI0029CA2124|nr:ATP-binding protein [Maridesulfovibrio sp.]